MTRFGWLMVLGALLLIGSVLGAVWLSTTRQTNDLAATEPALTVDPNTLSIYTNGEYGFSFFYPATDVLQDSFGTSSVPWRVNSTASGTPIVLVTNPAGQVRIGATDEAKELKTCTRPQPAEYPLPSRTLGSTTFATFTFDRVGTDDQLRITSFRTIHEKRCFVIEILEPFRAGATTTPALTAIVQSFTFAR